MRQFNPVLRRHNLARRKKNKIKKRPFGKFQKRNKNPKRPSDVPDATSITRSSKIKRGATRGHSAITFKRQGVQR